MLNNAVKIWNFLQGTITPWSLGDFVDKKSTGPKAKWSIYWFSGLSTGKPEWFDFMGYIEIIESEVAEADQRAVRKLHSVCLSLCPYIYSNEELAQCFHFNVKSSAFEQICSLYVCHECASHSWGLCPEKHIQLPRVSIHTPQTFPINITHLRRLFWG